MGTGKCRDKNRKTNIERYEDNERCREMDREKDR